MKRAAGMAGMLLIGACAAAPADPLEGIPEAGAGKCDAARAQALIGRTATTELGGEALRLTGAKALRWIQPGTMVTMDFRTDRLNIELDAQNRVTKIRCG